MLESFILLKSCSRAIVCSIPCPIVWCAIVGKGNNSHTDISIWVIIYLQWVPHQCVTDYSSLVMSIPYDLYTVLHRYTHVLYSF